MKELRKLLKNNINQLIVYFVELCNIEISSVKYNYTDMKKYRNIPWETLKKVVFLEIDEDILKEFDNPTKEIEVLLLDYFVEKNVKDNSLVTICGFYDNNQELENYFYMWILFCITYKLNEINDNIQESFILFTLILPYIYKSLKLGEFSFQKGDEKWYQNIQIKSKISSLNNEDKEEVKENIRKMVDIYWKEHDLCPSWGQREIAIEDAVAGIFNILKLKTKENENEKKHGVDKLQ